jgi:hypothetical protein
MENEADAELDIVEMGGWEDVEKEMGISIDADIDADAHSDFDSYTAVSGKARYSLGQKHMPFRRTSRLWLDIVAALTLGMFDIIVRLVMWIFKR